MKEYSYNMNEFEVLVSMCVAHGWDFEVRDIWDGRQIILYAKSEDPFDKNRKILNDSIIHSSSYGHAEGLLETWGVDDVEGYLTAQQVLKIWKQNVKNNHSYIPL